MRWSWETEKDGRLHYLDITYNEVVFGSHAGNPHSDIAGACSHDEFLAGQFQADVASIFGGAALQEAIAAARDAGNHEPFRAQLEHVRWIKGSIELLPVDASLEAAINEKDVINGYTAYGNAGGYKTIVKSDTTTLVIERSTGFVQDIAGEIKPVILGGHCSGVVELHDMYFAVYDGNFAMISSNGRVLFDTERNQTNPLFGDALRITSVARHGDIIMVKYAWFNHRDGMPGILRFEPGKGFTSRYDLVE